MAERVFTAREHGLADVDGAALLGLPSRRTPRRPRGLLFAVLLGATALLLLAVIGAAFVGSGPWAWAVGLVYIGYDTWLLGHMVSASRRAIQEARPPGPAGPTPTLAVVIAARNERQVLPAALDALLAQDDQPERILLVDDGSSDGTAALLARRYGIAQGGGPVWQSSLHPRLSLLSKENSGKARSLNLALERLTEEVVVTLDADTVLEPGAIAAVRRAFGAEPALWAACGVLRPVCRGGGIARVFQLYQTFEYLRAFLWRLAWMNEGTLVLVSGAFAGFRRSALLEAGGFDPGCRVEDYELLYRLHRLAGDTGRSLSVRVIGDARAVTDAPAGLRVFLRQRQRWFAGFVETLFRHREMVGDARYGRLGTFHLIVKTVDTLLPLYGLAAIVTLACFVALRRTLDPVVLAALAVKFAFDLLMHARCTWLSARWQRTPLSPRVVAGSLLATLTEPFAFQLFRQLGALLGWISFLRGRIEWSPQRSTSADEREP